MSATASRRAPATTSSWRERRGSIAGEAVSPDDDKEGRMLWLLLAAPLALILAYAGAPAPAIFFCAALAIVPIASLIVQGTEAIARYTAPAIGGLLNATFGNLPELIIAVVPLKAGLVEM